MHTVATTPGPIPGPGHPRQTLPNTPNRRVGPPLADLPHLDEARVRELLNQLGLAPDPAELHAWYFSQPGPGRESTPRHTWQQASVLAQIQLHARTGTKIELRELARLAGIANGDPSVPFRVVHRLQALGALQVQGGKRHRDAHGRVRRTCQSYRLQHPPGMPVTPERAMAARLYAWAIGAGVDEREARSCCRSGPAGAERLAHLGRLKQLQRESRERRAREADERQRMAADVRCRSGGIASAAEVGADLMALLEDRQGLVQHGDSYSEPGSPSVPSNGSSVGTEQAQSPRTARRRAHARNSSRPTGRNPDEEQAEFDVVVYAEKIGSRLPWLDGHTVVTEARRRGISAVRAAREYLEFAGDALDHSRAGRVRRPAAWAMGAFKARMAALEVG